MGRMRHAVLPLPPPPALNRVGLYTEIAVHVGKPGVLLLFPLWGGLRLRLHLQRW